MREELLKVAKPILFNTEMVQAILEDRKTVTRRVIKLENGYHLEGKASEITENIKLFGSDAIFYNEVETNKKLKSLYRIGDILYVRETWQNGSFLEDNKGKAVDYIYKADDTKEYNSYSDWGIKWRPSIHMPKEAARIFLKVTDVRVEKLQDITKDWNNFKKEGIIEEHGFRSEMHRDFIELWDSTIKKHDLYNYGWEVNPWVWVIEFERVRI